MSAIIAGFWLRFHTVNHAQHEVIGDSYSELLKKVSSLGKERQELSRKGKHLVGNKVSILREELGNDMTQ